MTKSPICGARMSRLFSAIMAMLAAAESWQPTANDFGPKLKFSDRSSAEILEPYTP